VGRLNTGIGALRSLAADLTELQADVAALSGEQEVGWDGTGTTSTGVFPSSQVLAAGPFPVSATGRLTSIKLVCGGGGTAGSGTQVVKFVAWADSAGNAGSRIAVSSELTIAYADTLIERELAITGGPIVATGDLIHLGTHSGTTAAVGRFGYATGQAGKKYAWASDVYSDGTATAFGTEIGHATGQVLQIKAVVEPVTNPVTSDDVTSIVTLTQSEYDALTPDPDTLYVVT
jgi:hypothetical protein